MKDSQNMHYLNYRIILFTLFPVVLFCSFYEPVLISNVTKTSVLNKEVPVIKGKVKQIITFFGNSNFNTIKRKQHKIKSLVEFNSGGKATMFLKKNYFSDTLLIVKSQYFENQLIKQIIINSDEAQKEVTFQYDENDKLKSKLVERGSNDDFVILSEHNDSGRLVKERFVSIQKLDSIELQLITYSYLNDKESNSTFVVIDNHSFNGNNVHHQIDSILFNSHGKLVRSFSPFRNFEIIDKYRKNQTLLSRKTYRNGIIESTIKFNEFENVSLLTKYKDGRISDKEKFEYEYDEIGNWIVKKAFLVMNSNEMDVFTPNYYETRAISYYK